MACTVPTARRDRPAELKLGDVQGLLEAQKMDVEFSPISWPRVSWRDTSCSDYHGRDLLDTDTPRIGDVLLYVHHRIL